MPEGSGAVPPSTTTRFQVLRWAEVHAKQAQHAAGTRQPAAREPQAGRAAHAAGQRPAGPQPACLCAPPGVPAMASRSRSMACLSSASMRRVTLRGGAKGTAGPAWEWEMPGCAHVPREGRGSTALGQPCLEGVAAGPRLPPCSCELKRLGKQGGQPQKKDRPPGWRRRLLLSLCRRLLSLCRRRPLGLLLLLPLRGVAPPSPLAHHRHLLHHLLHLPAGEAGGQAGGRAEGPVGQGGPTPRVQLACGSMRLPSICRHAVAQRAADAGCCWAGQRAPHRAADYSPACCSPACCRAGQRGPLPDLVDLHMVAGVSVLLLGRVLHELRAGRAQQPVVPLPEGVPSQGGEQGGWSDPGRGAAPWSSWSARGRECCAQWARPAGLPPGWAPARSS